MVAPDPWGERAIPRPHIKTVSYDTTSIRSLAGLLNDPAVDRREAELILQYPTVYIVNNKANGKYRVYVGETSDIQSRTSQHLKVDPKSREDWRFLGAVESAQMHVIAHEFFNKSLTLDVENQLMMCLGCIDSVEEVFNRRTNRQNKYYTREYFDDIFTEIWKALRDTDENLFPVEEAVRASALFKASPFHRLTDEQISAKVEIKAHIENALEKEKFGQLIMVEGQAGSGKTVLLSSLFYDLMQVTKEEAEPILQSDPLATDALASHKLNVRLLVNQKQQLVVYEQIARKLGLYSTNSPTVLKPTTFINQTSPVDEEFGRTSDVVDVVLIDEAHLLWTQGNQSYRGSNQLQDLLDRARVVVAVFDENQILQTNQYWEDSAREKIINKHCVETISLKNQMRMRAGERTVSWIRGLVDTGTITPLNLDSRGLDDAGYEVRVFDDPGAMHAEIERLDRLAREESDSLLESELAEATGLARTVATYDWDYGNDFDPTVGKFYNVEIGDFVMPWNLQLELPKVGRRKLKNLSWAEQPHTIGEIGSTFTVHGFDLNYVGVIIGPSVKYRDGKVIYDPTESKNKKATNRRTLDNGAKEALGERLLRNELNILLTRGVKGLFIFAVDEELQRALKNSIVTLSDLI